MRVRKLTERILKRQISRRCVACRKSGDKDELLRIVLKDGSELAADFEGTMPGRGAYLHRRAECLIRSAGRIEWSRVFKTKLPVSRASVDALYDQLKGLIRDSVTGSSETGEPERGRKAGKGRVRF